MQDGDGIHQLLSLSNNKAIQLLRSTLEDTQVPKNYDENKK